MSAAVTTISLDEARSFVAAELAGSFGEAEAWLLERFRRGELRAWCEWGYAVMPHGDVVFGRELSREQWILTDQIEWNCSRVNIRSKAAKELRFASAVYLDRDELLSSWQPEDHRPRLAQKPATAPRRRGPKPEILDRVCAHMRDTGLDRVRTMKVTEMQATFGASADTCKRARDRVIPEFRS